MKEYIDKKKLIDELKRDFADDCNIYNCHIDKMIRDQKYEFAIDVIQDAAVEDVTEVVRCKDCKVPHNKWTGCPKLGGLVTPPDFYCAFGER